MGQCSVNITHWFHYLSLSLYQSYSSTYTILPLITDCKNALLLSLDQWCSVSESWSVLHALAKRLKDWIELEESGNETSIQEDEDEGEVKNSETEETLEKKDIDSIAHYFLEYHAKKQEDEELGDLSEERDGSEEVNNEATGNSLYLLKPFITLY